MFSSVFVLGGSVLREHNHLIATCAQENIYFSGTKGDAIERVKCYWPNWGACTLALEALRLSKPPD